MDQSRLKLSWILHGVWSRRRIITERWRSYFRLLEIQLSLFAAVADSGQWSVVLGHLGIGLFCLRGSNRDWDRQPNRNLIKLRHKQTHWTETLHRRLVMLHCGTKMLSRKPEVFALQILTWVTEICKIMLEQWLNLALSDSWTMNFLTSIYANSPSHHNQMTPLSIQAQHGLTAHKCKLCSKIFQIKGRKGWGVIEAERYGVEKNNH